MYQYLICISGGNCRYEVTHYNTQINAIPHLIAQVMGSPGLKQWVLMNSIQENCTWDLVDLSKDRHFCAMGHSTQIDLRFQQYEV